MFELLNDDSDKLCLAISLPKLDYTRHGHFIPLNDLSEESLSSSSFDALLVSGLLPEGNQKLFDLCNKKGAEFIVFNTL